MPKRGASRARPGYGTSRSPRFRAAFALPHTLALTFFPRWLTDVVRGFGPIATRLVAGNVHDAVVDLVEGHSDLLLCYRHPHHPVELDSDRYPMLELGAEAMLPYSVAAKSGAARFRLPGAPDAPVPYLANREVPGLHADR